MDRATRRNLFWINEIPVDVDYKKIKELKGLEPHQVIKLLEMDFFESKIPTPNFVDYGNKKRKIINKGMDESTEGVEQVTEDGFIVSCWNGIVYYVKQNGIKETLFDTRAQKISSADIGYDVQNKIIYVPTFFGKSIVAYQLK